MDWEIPGTNESLAWLNLPNCLEMISTIAKNSNKGCWDKKPHVSIWMGLDETVVYTHMLLKHGMLCYFTNRCVVLPKLKSWENLVPIEERLWSLHHIKFIGKNFYLIIFKEVDHHALALVVKPWFVDKNYMYTFAWDPTFDVSIGGIFRSFGLGQTPLLGVVA